MKTFFGVFYYPYRINACTIKIITCIYIYYTRDYENKNENKNNKKKKK
jgi:hypothetical protein